jgi:thiamine kinase-like enzyme
MNKIFDLFDTDKVKELFSREILPIYPDFVDIKKIKIIPHKKLIWTLTYHIVIEFKTTFQTREGKMQNLPIYCTAHSNEPRKNVYDGLKFLWENNFGRGYLTIPHPMFYNEYYNGAFYRGVKGKNLYQYIKNKNFSEIEIIVKKTADWFCKLHSLKTKHARNFNKENSRIATVFPGSKLIFKKIDEVCPRYSDKYKKIYGLLVEKENEFFNSTSQRWLVHGDAHPENVIRMSKNKIALIDFADLCLGDYARDLGTFLQQLDYMSNRKIGDKDYTEKLKKLFLESYLAKNKRVKSDWNLEARIANYYNWTAMRTSTHFLLKANPEPERAEPLIKEVCDKLNIINKYK